MVQDASFRVSGLIRFTGRGLGFRCSGLGLSQGLGLGSKVQALTYKI